MLGRRNGQFGLGRDDLSVLETERSDSSDYEKMRDILIRAAVDVERWISELPDAYADLRMGFLSLRRDLAQVAGVPLVRGVPPKV